MGTRLALSLLVLVLAGCSTSSSSPGASPSPTSASTSAVPAPTATPRTVPSATAAPVTVDKAYAQVVHSVCLALARRDAGTIIGLLPYYQYNSGLRYGVMGDGEGQTGDPALMRSWLEHANVRCEYFSNAGHGHGTVLASGWGQRGGSALLELDTFSGHWKINDFTFGDRGTLYHAMQTARPILPYR